MPDAYLGKDVRCFLAATDPGGALLADLSIGVTDLSLDAEVTRGVITPDGSNSRIIVPILLDESIGIGSIIPVNAESLALSRRAGEECLVVLDYRGIGIDSAVAGVALIPAGAVRSPVDDLTSVSLTLEAKEPFYDFDARTARAGDSYTFRPGETHVLMVLKGTIPNNAYTQIAWDGAAGNVRATAASAQLITRPAAAAGFTFSISGWGSAVPDVDIYAGKVHEPF